VYIHCLQYSVYDSTTNQTCFLKLRFEQAELGSPFLTFSYKECIVDYSKRLGNLATLLYTDTVAGRSNSSSFHYLLVRIREGVRHTLKRLRHGPKVALMLSGSSPSRNKASILSLIDYGSINKYINNEV
jgi:hypothetical protein